MGQEIEIPDPDTPEYLSVFLALERSHPRLASRLAEAERADPAELLDPYTPRAPKVTPRHRLNAFVEKNFMRRGLDRKLVMDRQRVFKTALYTAGGVMVAGLIWSVVAPKPAETADVPAETQPVATDPAGTGSTAGAFAPIDGTGEAQEAAMPTSPAGDATFAPAAPDSAPRPVSAASSASATPPPPEVFNQVTNDPYAPAPPSASTPTPLPVDSTPLPVVAAPEPSTTSPFGGTDPDPAPVAVVSAPNPVRTPPPSPFADPEPSAPTDAASLPVVEAPFGGVAAPPAAPVQNPSGQTASTPPQDVPTRGGALIYQAPRKEDAQAAPKSALLYQAPRQSTPEGQGSARNAMIYQATRPASVPAQADSEQSAMLYQTSARGTAAGTGSSLVFQQAGEASGSSAAPAQGATAPAFGQAVDPDAPRFAATSVITGKLFTSIRAAAGMAVPVIVLSQDGNWVGSASYNTRLGRVDMRFTSFVMHKNSKVYPVFATAYQKASNGTLSEGVSANVHPIAPTLALDLARAGLNGLNAYTQSLQNAGTTTYNGSLVTTTRQAPELVQVLRGEVGKVFALPEGNQSIQIVADIAAGTEVQLVYGVGSDQQEFGLR